MAERAGVGRGALSADSGRRSQEVGVGHPGGFVPEPQGGGGGGWSHSVSGQLWLLRYHPGVTPGEARPGPLQMVRWLWGLPGPQGLRVGGGEAPVPRAGERRNRGRGHRRPAPAVSAAAVRAPLRNGPSHPHFSSQHQEETQLPLSSAAVASERYAAHDHRALHTPTLSESAPPLSPPAPQVAVVSCPLLFGKPPVPANSALGARLNAPLILQFPLGCRLWAAATTLRGPTLQPQPGRGERIVSNSIYVQVEKDCVSPAA